MSTVAIDFARFTTIPTRNPGRVHFLFACPGCDWVYEDTVTPFGVAVARVLCAAHVVTHK